jgi:hypothetical protein
MPFFKVMLVRWVVDPVAAAPTAASLASLVGSITTRAYLQVLISGFQCPES